MSSRGGRGGRDGRSLPSIPSLWWGHPLHGIREFAEIWVGNRWHLLETWSLQRGVRVKLSPGFWCRCLCGVFFNLATSAGARDALLFLSVLCFVLHSAAYLSSWFPPRHLWFPRSTSEVDRRHTAALGASDGMQRFWESARAFSPQCSVPRPIHVMGGSTLYARATQFPTEDNLTLTCLIISKGWSTVSGFQLLGASLTLCSMLSGHRPLDLSGNLFPRWKSEARGEVVSLAQVQPAKKWQQRVETIFS